MEERAETWNRYRGGSLAISAEHSISPSVVRCFVPGNFPSSLTKTFQVGSRGKNLRLLERIKAMRSMVLNDPRPHKVKIKQRKTENYSKARCNDPFYFLFPIWLLSVTVGDKSPRARTCALICASSSCLRCQDTRYIHSFFSILLLRPPNSMSPHEAQPLELLSRFIREVLLNRSSPQGADLRHDASAK